MSTAPIEHLLDAVPALRLLPAPASEPPYDDERAGGPLPLRAAESVRPWLRMVPAGARATTDPPATEPVLPPAGPFAQSLVQRLLEVLAGIRPLTHLRRDTSLGVYEDLERLLLGRPRSTGARPDGRAVRSVHAQLRPDAVGVAEVAATVRRDGRYAALALRLESVEGRWCCTELVGG